MVPGFHTAALSVILLPLTGLAALLLSYFCVAKLRLWAERRQILDIPNDRSSHQQPVPRGGGLAIVTVTLVGTALFVFVQETSLLSVFFAYLCGALLIVAVSWVDDVRSLPTGMRFCAHTASALLAVWVFGPWKTVEIPVSGELFLGMLAVPITLLWIVGLTNAYNFMDGIDGIAAGQAVVAALGWTALGWLTGQYFLSALGLFLAASSLGFLGHNWSPARIFMGDVGSAFLGYSFAILPPMGSFLLGGPRSQAQFPTIGLLFVWPFVFDTSFTILRRLARGERVYTAHRSHLYQRLVIAGYSHRFVTLLYITLALAGAILSLAWFAGIKGSALAVASLIPLLCFLLWLFVRRAERRRAVQDPIPVRPLPNPS